MSSLKIHYEGWVSLPAALRQQLGLNSGDQLDVELVDGAIVLRPATKTKHPLSVKERKAAIEPPAPDVPEAPTLTDVAPARRKPGRPRKAEAAAELTATAPKRPRGRPKGARALQAEPPPVPAVSSEPWKLRRKEDLHPQATNVEHRPPPVPFLIGPEAKRARRRKSGVRFATSSVEVRKLGPGRQHNRPRAFSWAVRLPT